MPLIDLPSEILQAIIKATLPEGFECLALSCKVVYNASQIYVPKHNMLKRSYSSFSYHAVLDDEILQLSTHPNASAATELFSSIQLLNEIAQDPLIARYMRECDFRNDKGTDAWRPGMKDNIERLLKSSKHLAEAQQDPDQWLRKMKYIEDDDHIWTSFFPACFLLTLLPNVTKVTLPEEWNDFPETVYDDEDSRALWALLDSIVKRANAYETESLRKLEIIRPSAGIGYENRWGLQTYAPLLALPNVQEFYAGSCVAKDDGYTGKPFVPRYDSLASNLEIVELPGACIDAIQMTGFVSNTRNLKCLRFSYEGKWHGCGNNWDAGAFVATLEKYLGPTLEQLSLGIVECFGCIGTGVHSMKGFSALKWLDLDVALLLGPPYDPKIPDQAEEIGYEGTVEGDIQVPTLGKLLPSSIRSLTLLCNGTEASADTLDDLFLGWHSDDRLAQLPHLAELNIALGDTGPESRRGYGDIERITGLPGRVIPHHDSTAPWQRDFNEKFEVEDL